MSSRELYLGPDFGNIDTPNQPDSTHGYTVAHQSMGFGLTREEVRGPAAGLTPEEWEDILNQSN